METPTDHMDFANSALQLLIEGAPSRKRPPLAIWILKIRPSNLVVGGAPSHEKTPTGNLNLADSALRPFEGALSHKKGFSWQSKLYSWPFNF